MGLLCALGAMLVLSNACSDPDTRPPPGVGNNPKPPGHVGDGNGGGNGNDPDGGFVVPSDGGTFAAKPSCPSGASSCEGACPDGGVICAGNCGFLAPVEYPFSGNPKALAIGDIDSDGDADIVTANNDGRSVAVLLNRDDGLFQTPSLWWAGKNPTAVALADINGDQKPELLVANSGDSNIGVFQGKGNGTFQKPTSYPAGSALRDMVVGAFGAGGRGVAVLGAQTLAVHEVNSDGSLKAAVEYPVGSGSHSMVVADFNRDDRQDIAVSHEVTCDSSSETRCQSVGVLLSNRDGTFQAQRLTSTGGRPRGLLAADLDTDAVMDLVVADASSNQVLVLRGRGDGTFYPPVRYATGKAPSRLVLADVNRDFVQDLLVTSATGNQVSLLLGQPGGTFAQQVLLTANPHDVGLQGLAAVDFDGDRFQDLAVLTGSGIQMLWGICR